MKQKKIKDQEKTENEATSKEEKKKEKKRISSLVKEETKPKWKDDSKLEDIIRTYYEEFEVSEKDIKEDIQKLHNYL